MKVYKIKHILKDDIVTNYLVSNDQDITYIKELIYLNKVLKESKYDKLEEMMEYDSLKDNKLIDSIILDNPFDLDWIDTFKSTYTIYLDEVTNKFSEKICNEIQKFSKDKDPVRIHEYIIYKWDKKVKVLDIDTDCCYIIEV